MGGLGSPFRALRRGASSGDPRAAAANLKTLNRPSPPR